MKKPLLKPVQGTSKPTNKVAPDVQLANPSLWDTPAYCMCAPHTFETDDPNNVWMQSLPESKREIDYDIARQQWLSLYNYLAGDAYVQLVPNHQKYQDIVFCANLGITLCHLPEPVVVVSNYKSPPRKGEEDVGRVLFEEMGYRVTRPPFTWEGEAELKHVVDNKYVGGFGFRTDPKVYDWFEDRYDMKVVRVEMTDEKLYHWDCEFFPLTTKTALACTSIMTDQEVRAIEKVCDIIPVSKELAHGAITNCVRMGQFILCMGNNPVTMKLSDPEREIEIKKRAFFERVLPKLGMEPVFFALNEYEKGGAALSCLVMHLNRASYSVPLV